MLLWYHAFCNFILISQRVGHRKMTSEVWDSTSSESESYEVWKKLDKVSYIECRGFGFCVVFEWGRVSRLEKLAEIRLFWGKFEWNLEWGRVFDFISKFSVISLFFKGLAANHKWSVTEGNWSAESAFPPSFRAKILTSIENQKYWGANYQIFSFVARLKNAKVRLQGLAKYPKILSNF